MLKICMIIDVKSGFAKRTTPTTGEPNTHHRRHLLRFWSVWGVGLHFFGNEYLLVCDFQTGAPSCHFSRPNMDGSSRLFSVQPKTNHFPNLHALDPVCSWGLDATTRFQFSHHVTSTRGNQEAGLECKWPHTHKLRTGHTQFGLNANYKIPNCKKPFLDLVSYLQVNLHDNASSNASDPISYRSNQKVELASTLRPPERNNGCVFQT